LRLGVDHQIDHYRAGMSPKYQAQRFLGPSISRQLETSGFWPRLRPGNVGRAVCVGSTRLLSATLKTPVTKQCIFFENILLGGVCAVFCTISIGIAEGSALQFIRNPAYKDEDEQR
jgi:hypothetical protein